MKHGKVQIDGDITLATGATADEISIDGTLVGDSDTAIPTEKAVKTYTDSLVNGLDWKNSCRLASDQNTNWTTSATASFSAGTLTLASLTAGSSRGLIDVIESVDGDRILIKDAGAVLSGTGKDDKYNGLWEVTGGTTTTLTLTRTTDADEDAEVTANLAVFIEEGAVNADKGYTLITADPITVNTTAQIYTQFTAGISTEINDLETDGAEGILTTEIPIGTGADTVNYKSLSGDVTMDNAGVVSVSDLTITSEAAEDFLVRNAANSAWEAQGGTQLVKVITFSYDISVTGSLAVTGVGFKPKAILVVTTLAGNTQANSLGFTDGSTDGGYAAQDNLVPGAVSIHDFLGRYEVGGGADASFTHVTFDSDGFTIVRVKTGSPTGTVNVRCWCFR